MNKYSYFILRSGIGLSMFGHGFVRIFKLNAFSAWMAGQFEKSMMPQALVVPFSYILPFVELITGVLLILGLFTKQALLLGSIAMLMLISGTTLIENWDVLPSQLIHIAFFAVLLQFIGSNSFCLDKHN